MCHFFYRPGMGAYLTCCKKFKDKDTRAALRAGARIRVSRNETEDPRAPLLNRRLDDKIPELPAFDKDLDDFVDALSSDDDGAIPDDNEINAILNEKRD
jgi:hypothetical protein